MLNINLRIFILFVCVLLTHAGVIKQLDDVFETTTESIEDMVTTMKTEIATVKNVISINNVEKKLDAVSRDEEATILIMDQTVKDPAPAKSIKTEAKVVRSEKLGKLLLLSTPKIAEKAKQPEENLESEETDETIENETQVPIATTTIVEKFEGITESITESNDEQTTDHVKSLGDITAEDRKQTTKSLLTDVATTSDKITKLYKINDTLYDEKIKSQTKNTISPDISAYDEPKVNPNSNIGSIILEETEADYVLVEGSYADIDSELHLQPIVQSIEIVPSSLDDTLLISYV